MMRLALMTTLLTTSLALVGCGGSSHHGVPAPPSPAPGARTARAAARTFLNGWLLYEYGHAKPAVMKDLTPTLRTSLAAYPPDIPPTRTSWHLYGRLVSLALYRHASSWRGRAQLTDGQGDNFDETVQLVQTGGRWLVDLIIAQP
jgi:hypothetical protein